MSLGRCNVHTERDVSMLPHLLEFADNAFGVKTHALEFCIFCENQPRIDRLFPRERSLHPARYDVLPVFYVIIALDFKTGTVSPDWFDAKILQLVRYCCNPDNLIRSETLLLLSKQYLEILTDITSSC